MSSKNTFSSNFRISKTTLRTNVSNIQEKQNSFLSIFKESIRYTDDIFWKNKLMDASRGVFPKFFSYKDGELIYGKNKLELDIKHISNDPKIAVNDFISFLKEKEKIYSSSDIQNMNIEDKFNEPLKIKTWADYKKKDREHMIDFYIEKMERLMKLNDKEIDELKRKILEGIDMKIFDKNNILVDKDNCITKIEGLCMTKDRSFIISKSLIDKCQIKKPKESSNNSKYIKDKTQFLQKWKKYIETLDKSYKKSDICNNILEDPSEDDIKIAYESSSIFI